MIKRKKVANKTAFILGMLCINIIAVFVYQQVVKVVNTEKGELIEYAQETGNEITERLTAELQHTEHIVDSTAFCLQNNLMRLTDSIQIKKMLYEILMKCSFLDGAYIAFENARDAGYSERLYSQYLQREKGNFIVTHFEDYYDYTVDSSSAVWFNLPRKRKSPMWIAPFFELSGNKRINSYVVPVQLNDSSICVVGGNYSSSNLYFMLNSWKTSRLGYPYLMNRKGEFIAHPDNDTRTLKEIGIDAGEPELVKLGQAIEDGLNEIPDMNYHLNTVSKAMCWEVVFPIEYLDWFLGISVADQQVYSNPVFFNKQRQYYISYSLFFFGILLIAELIILRKRKFEYNHFQQLGFVAYCIFLIIEIVFIYNYSLRYPIVEFSDMELHNSIVRKKKLLESIADNQQKKEKIAQSYDRWNFAMLLDSEGIIDYVELYTKSIKNKDGNKVYSVPTGLYLQTIHFSDSYSAVMTGYIWQTYSDSTIKRGVLFPDAEELFVELVDSSCVFLTCGDRAQFYRWYFSIEIREPFNYRLYPFDRNDLWLRIWHVDFDNNVVLVPDLDAYKLFHPSFKPGIDKDIVIQGWNVEGSYFSFKEKNYNTTFGKNYRIVKNSFPELHYNIMLKRNYLDPIITRIIPLVVLILMTYSIALIAKEEDALNVAIACSGLLFVAVFEQVNLRRSLDTSGIIYMEYYYFITYIILMLVSLNSTINNYFKNRFSIQNNIFDISKFYWPLVLSFIFVSALFTFY